MDEALCHAHRDLYGSASAGTFSLFGVTPFFRDINSHIKVKVRKNNIVFDSTTKNKSREWKWLGLIFFDDAKLIGPNDVPKISNYGLRKSYLYTLEVAIIRAHSIYVEGLLTKPNQIKRQSYTQVRNVIRYTDKIR